MKNRLERNKARMTDSEDRRVWKTLSDQRRDRSSGRRRIAIPAAAGAFAIALFVMISYTTKDRAGRDEFYNMAALDRETSSEMLHVNETPTVVEETDKATSKYTIEEIHVFTEVIGSEHSVEKITTPVVERNDSPTIPKTREPIAPERALAKKKSDDRPGGKVALAKRETVIEKSASEAVEHVVEDPVAPIESMKRKKGEEISDRITQSEVLIAEETGIQTDRVATDAMSPLLSGAQGVNGVARPFDAGKSGRGTGTLMGTVMDSHTGTPLADADVTISRVGLKTNTETDGSFQFLDVPVGHYVVFGHLATKDGGYWGKDQSIEIRAGDTTTIHLALEFALDRNVNLSNPTAARLNYMQPSSGENEKKSRRAGGMARPDYPISVGGTDPVNGAAFDAMFFEHYGVNPFIDAEDDNLATFAVDVDNASYTMTRSYLEHGELPPKEAVRVEEFVNSFRHDYSQAKGGTFAIHLDAAPSPFGENLTLLRVGLKGREVEEENRKPAVLTFVIDVSGSMDRENRLGLVKRALYMLLDRMDEKDDVALVVYGSRAETILRHTSLEERETIEEAIDRLVPGGSTNAEEGLVEGYRLADRGFRRGCINRVILCSDGVANVGRTGADGILDRIAREAERGIEMTAVGFGMANYNDVLMEKLANRGNGNYYYVDGISEAKRVFVENLTGTLQTIAREVKIQVEFKEGTVRRYRLLGYENRDVADRDFRNDDIDAGEVGAGHEVTALFEIRTERKPASDELVTVRIRYEDPENGKVREDKRKLDISAIHPSIEHADPTLRLDAAVAEFAEILRHSYWARGGDLREVYRLARDTARDLRDRDDVNELLDLVDRAERLWEENIGEYDHDSGIRPVWEPKKRN